MRHPIKILAACLILSACSFQSTSSKVKTATAPSPTETPPQTVNRTIAFASEVNPINDQKKLTIVITSTNTISNALGLQEEAKIGIRCEARQAVEVFVDAQAYLGDNDIIQIRLDDGIPSAQVWSKSQDRTGLFAPDPRQFLSLMAARKKLVLQWEPYSATPQAAIFDLTGFSDYIQKLSAEGCMV